MRYLPSQAEGELELELEACSSRALLQQQRQ